MIHEGNIMVIKISLLFVLFICLKLGYTNFRDRYMCIDRNGRNKWIIIIFILTSSFSEMTFCFKSPQGYIRVFIWSFPV